MILPYLASILPFARAPMTWTLFALNVLMWALMGPIENQMDEKMLRIFSQATDIQTQGRIYKKYLESQGLPLENSDLGALGKKALRDQDFLRSAQSLSIAGDQVAIKVWQKDLDSFELKNKMRPVTIFGLSSTHLRWTSWVTYQFMHSGFVHMAGNMLLLLILGTAIEILAGGLTVMFIYVAGGVLGAMFFVELHGLSTAPLVGASAAVTALIGFYPVIERRRRVAFLYFLSPFNKFFGVIYLPTLLVWLFFLIPDFASYLSMASESSSVAHAAHVGGGMFGIVSGLAYVIARR